MADRDVDVNLKVAVEGEEQVNSLAQALGKLGETSTSATSNVSGSLQSVAKDVDSAADKIKTAADNFVVAEKSSLLPGETQAEAIARKMGPPADPTEIAKRAEEAFWEGRKRVADKMSSQAGKDAAMSGKKASDILDEMKGKMGGITESASPAVNVLSQLGGVLQKLLIAGAVAGAFHELVKAFQTTYGYAKDLAAQTLRNAAQADRAQTSLTEAQTDSVIGTTILGKAYDQLNDKVFKQFSAYRLGKGLPGDKEIFQRLGMTPESLTKPGGGRRTILDLMQQWAEQYQGMRKELEAAPSDEARDAIQKRLEQFRADLGRVAPGIADALASWTPEAIADLRAKINEVQKAVAVPLSDQQLKADAVRMQTELSSINQIFGNLRDIIGSYTMQPLLDFLSILREKGTEITPALGQFAGTLSQKIWETLGGIVRSINVAQWIDTLRGWANEFADIDATSIGEEIGKELNDIASLFKLLLDAIRFIVDSVRGFMNELSQTKAFFTGDWGRLKQLQQERALQMGLEPVIRPGQEPVAQTGPNVLGAQLGINEIESSVKNGVQAGMEAAKPTEAPAAPAAMDDVVKAAAEPIKTSVTEGGTQAGEKVKKAVSGAGSSVQSAMQAGASSAASAIQAAMVAGGAAAAEAIRGAMAGGIPGVGGASRGPDRPAPAPG